MTTHYKQSFPKGEAKKPKKQESISKKDAVNEKRIRAVGTGFIKLPPLGQIYKAANNIVWSRPELHNAIAQYAQHAWVDRPQYEPAAQKMVGYLQQLLRKNKFCCPITGVKLFGDTNFLSHGLGLDLITYRYGVVKGNIRLISSPLALIRCFGQPDPIVNGIDYNAFIPMPVSYVICRLLRQRLEEDKRFRNLPFTVTFGNDGRYGASALMTIRAHHDVDIIPGQTTGFQADTLIKRCIKKSWRNIDGRCFEAALIGDYIICEKIDYRHPLRKRMPRWYEGCQCRDNICPISMVSESNEYTTSDIRIYLSDPSVSILDTILDVAYNNIQMALRIILYRFQKEVYSAIE